MKNLMQSIGAIDDTNIRNALLALQEENQRLNRKLTDFQDIVLDMQDDRADYAVEFDEPNDIGYQVRRRQELTARMQSTQSNLLDEMVEQDIRHFIGGNSQLITQLEELFKLLGAEYSTARVINRLSLDDIIDMLRVEITRNATKVEIVS